ncbi:putative protein YNL108C [Saccharomyces cerevisiae S288c] [Rhizoctonia solani]|uniref:Transcription factor tau 55 kDa subunit n=1 Tax=Rhizoctonia solani TaxID=456999 RepID=A0A0K6G1H1_9AGAM|nr:putative protein YNL108C [Saccharomyces cerevisiae S288c] [Rhizoctonia solani]
MVRTILIARHGFRLNWLTNDWASPTGTKKDPPLAAYGVAQAADLANFIKSLPEEHRPTLLFSSPYYRCLQTTNPTSEVLGIPIYVEHGLSEWYSPVTPGTGLHPRPQSAETLKQYFPSIDPSWESIYYPDRRGETVKGVHDRCAEFLDAFISRIENHPTFGAHKNILLVSHAATCAALVRHLVNDRVLPIRVGTCSLSILERSEDDRWVPQGELVEAKFLPGGVERDWGFEDAIYKDDKVIDDPGVYAEEEDSGFTGLVPDKAFQAKNSLSQIGIDCSITSRHPSSIISSVLLSTDYRIVPEVTTNLPIAEKDQAMPATRAKKTTKAEARSQKATKKATDDGEYQDGVDSEGEVASVTSDTNEADMELFRAAFASVKSKNTKKKNAEFLNKNQALIDEARKQAEAMQSAGLAHIEQLIRGFEAASQLSNNDDISAFASLVGDRSASLNTASRDLFETSQLSLNELAANYEKAFGAADKEVQGRAHHREKIRRQTVRHTYQILEKGIEEQKLITDATNFIKNFQRLMSL